MSTLFCILLPSSLSSEPVHDKKSLDYKGHGKDALL